MAVVLDVLSEETVVPAGGGIEIRLATAVRERARTVGDRRAVAMDAYADALEEIPRTLATNGGVAAIDIVTELRRCEDSGFDTASGDVREAFPAGPLVSPRVVSASLDTATHIATRLVRIDDVLTGGEDEEWISADEIDPRPVPSRDFDY
jgi:chaperonin GroEL (HSP60 family)